MRDRTLTMTKGILSVAFVGVLVFLGMKDRLSYEYPGGGPGLALLPVSDGSPSCSGCHAIVNVKYMREFPATGMLTAQGELMENKHYKQIRDGEGGYKLLTADERSKLLNRVQLIDKNASVTIQAPRSARLGTTIQVVVTTKGGIGPGNGVMLVDSDLRFQARPVQGNGWLIVGPPKVIGPDGKPQTFWLDKRYGNLEKNLNFVVVGASSDPEKGQYATTEVTWTLRTPRKPGKYGLAAAFLYGTEEPNEHKEAGKWMLPAGGLTGPSGRIMFSDVIEVDVR